MSSTKKAAGITLLCKTLVCNSIYFQVNTPRIFHGLKRIWEFLDERGLRTDTET
jgi:hypothetical protein